MFCASCIFGICRGRDFFPASKKLRANSVGEEWVYPGLIWENRPIQMGLTDVPYEKTFLESDREERGIAFGVWDFRPNRHRVVGVIES